jgi:hypothetical protein
VKRLERPASRRRDPRQQVAEPARARAGRFRTGEIRTLVATDIAARGIDVDGISHVINFDLPNVPGDLRPPHRPHRARRRRRRRDLANHGAGQGPRPIASTQPVGTDFAKVSFMQPR